MKLTNLLVLLYAGVTAQSPDCSKFHKRDNQRAKLDNQHAKQLSDLQSPLEKRVLERILEKRSQSTKRDSSDGNYAEVDHDESSNYENIRLVNVFSTKDYVCMLSPEAHAGPYYISEASVDTHWDGLEKDFFIDSDSEFELYLEVYDAETCETLKDVFVQIWFCNSAGYYSGIDYPDSADRTGILNAHFSRQLSYPSEDDGFVDFTHGLTFPGHASDRTTHISYAVHANAKFGDHYEILESTIIHVGELYFDQKLLDKVGSMDPYNQNNNEVVLSEDDIQLKLLEGSVHPDPFVNYYVEEEEGFTGHKYFKFFAWAAIGVNTSASYKVEPAAQFDYEWITDGPANCDIFYYPYVSTTVQDLDFTYTTPSELIGDVEIPTAVDASSHPNVMIQSLSDDGELTLHFLSDETASATDDPSATSSESTGSESDSEADSESASESASESTNNKLASSASTTVENSGSTTSNEAASGAKASSIGSSTASTSASTSNGQVTLGTSFLAAVFALAFSLNL